MRWRGSGILRKARDFVLESPIWTGAERGGELPLTVADIPDIYAAVTGDGYTRMRHAVRGVELPTGLLPPKGFTGDGVAPTNPGGTLTFDFSSYEIELQPTAVSDLFRVRRGSGAQVLFDCVVFAQGHQAAIGTSSVWQIQQQETDAATWALIAEAINGNPNGSAYIIEPDDIGVTGTNYFEYAADGTFAVYGLCSARIEGSSLVVDWNGHPLAASRTEPPPIGGDTTALYLDIDFLSGGLDVTIWPDPEGAIGPGRADGSQAWVQLHLPTVDLATGSVLFYADAAGANLLAEVAIVTAFSATPTTYELKLGTVTQETIVSGLQNMMNGYGEGTDWVAPLTGSALKLSEFGFRHKQIRTGLFYRKDPGYGGDLTYLAQTISTDAAAVPASGAVVQFQGGADPVTLDPASPDASLAEGDYRYAPSWYRQIDKARSGIGDWALLDDHPGGDATVTDFPAPEDEGVDFLRLWRTLVNGLGDYFKVEDVPLTETSYLDSKSDLEIAGGFGSLLYNPRHYRSRPAGYPPHYRYLTSHLGSIFGAGLSRSAPQHGTMNVLKGNDWIEIIGPAVPTKLWVGRAINKDGTNIFYRVIDCDESTGFIRVATDYAEDSETDVAFTCEDDRPAHNIGSAHPHFHNQWPAPREFEGVDSKHADGITALLPRRQSLYAWTRGGTWFVGGGSPGNVQIEPVSGSVGCVNQRTLLVYEQRAYWLEGPAGFYAWDFIGPPQRISNPPFSSAEQEPTGIQGTVDRINWEALDWAHAVIDPDNRLIRWYVPVDGAEYPNIAITYDLKSGTWGTDESVSITAATSAILPDGGWAVLAGDVRGGIWVLDVGDSDGAFGIETVHSIKDSTKRTLVLSESQSWPEDLIGAPVIVVHGDNDWERGIIEKASMDTITLRDDMTRPASAGDQIVLGGIPQEIEPNLFDMGVKDEEKLAPVMWVAFDPVEETDASPVFELRIWDPEVEAFTDPMFDSSLGDLSRREGVERFRTNMRGYQLGFQVRAIVPGYRPSFDRFEIQAVVRGKPQQGA